MLKIQICFFSSNHWSALVAGSICLTCSAALSCPSIIVSEPYYMHTYLDRHALIISLSTVINWIIHQSAYSWFGNIQTTILYLIVSLIGMILQGKMNWPKRCKPCLTKPDHRLQNQPKQPHPSLQAVQQPAILDAVLETTARLTLAATVMWSATTSTTAVMTSQPLAATVSVLHVTIIVVSSVINRQSRITNERFLPADQPIRSLLFSYNLWGRIITIATSL